MKYKILVALTVMLSLSVCESCQPRSHSFLSNFEKFVIRVEKEADTYTKEDWAKADEAFERFRQEKLKYEESRVKFTPEERNKIGKLEARYYKVRVKYVGKGVWDDVKGEVEYVKGIAEELMEGF